MLKSIFGLPIATTEDITRSFPTEEYNLKILELIRWSGQSPISPFVPNSAVYKCGNGKYRCQKTKKYFTVKTGTVFSGTKIELQKWFICLLTFFDKRQWKYKQLATIVNEIEANNKTSKLLRDKIWFAINSPHYKDHIAKIRMTNTIIYFEHTLEAILNVPIQVK